MFDEERAELTRLRLAVVDAKDAHRRAEERVTVSATKLQMAKGNLAFAERMLNKYGNGESGRRETAARVKAQEFEAAQASANVNSLQLVEASLALDEVTAAHNELLSYLSDIEKVALRRIKKLSVERGFVQQLAVDMASKQLAGRMLTTNDCGFQIKFDWDSHRQEPVAEITLHVHNRPGRHDFVITESMVAKAKAKQAKKSPRRKRGEP